MRFDVVTSSHPNHDHCNWNCPFDNDLIISKFEREGWEKAVTYDLSTDSLKNLVSHGSGDLLIISALDQHQFRDDGARFAYDIRPHLGSLRLRYKRVILNTVEPIYSHLAKFDCEENGSPDVRRAAHETFSRILSPDLVIYNCRIDVAKSPFNSIYVSNGDVSLRSKEPMAWEDREDVLVFSGRGSVRNRPLHGSRGDLINNRRANLNFIKSIARKKNYSYIHINNSKTLQELYDVACRSKFEIQPRCGYNLHGLRVMTAMLCGSIPIIFKQSDELYHYYNDILIESETCFIVEGLKELDKEKLIKKIANRRLCADISKRIVKVAEAYCAKYNLERAAKYFL